LAILESSDVGPDHPDYAILNHLADSLVTALGGREVLSTTVPELIREAIDFVIDPVRTGRTGFDQLDNVEKTFVGLKVEHFLRDALDVPKGLRDLIIDGIDVDVKNTTRSTWMIPPETFSRSDPCVLIASDEVTNHCWFGVFLAKPDYLNKPNRDKKRSVSVYGKRNILWLLERAEYPRSRWADVDMARFRELRSVKFGNVRLAQFFRENLNAPIHRNVIESLLFDQKDFMKRIRGNGGVRDILRREAIAVLSGKYDAELIAKLGMARISADEFIAKTALNQSQFSVLRAENKID
jgi:hypothetical protein